MRLMRMIGLATLGFSAYKAYQNYSRRGSGNLSAGPSSGRGRFASLRRRGSV